MFTPAIQKDFQRLSRMLLVGKNTPPWNEADLSIMLVHQLDVPLAFDLAATRGIAGGTVDDLCRGVEPLIKTFRDLFFHRKPPLPLLQMTKELGKSFTRQGQMPVDDECLPPPVASMIYYLSIVAARLHYNERISTLNDQHIREGIGWALSQTWLSADVRILLSEARACFTDGS